MLGTLHFIILTLCIRVELEQEKRLALETTYLSEKYQVNQLVCVLSFLVT